jgi:hypothetical protein
MTSCEGPFGSVEMGGMFSSMGGARTRCPYKQRILLRWASSGNRGS